MALMHLQGRVLEQSRALVIRHLDKQEDYIQQLGRSKFCLLLRDIAGWYVLSSTTALTMVDQN